MSDDQPLIRVKLTNDVIDYPHNDLENAAWFFRERLQKALTANEPPEGIFLDMIALITMTSFALEGYVNALGWHRLRDDDKAFKTFEWKSVKDKIEDLAAHYKLAIDWATQPFSTVAPLVHLRNMFAHPKAAPAKEREQILDGKHNDFVTMLRAHKPEYERRLTWEFANQAYDDMDAIWQTLLKASGISPFELRSGGSQGIEVIGWIGPQGDITPA
jgi:hypothetical protein